MDGAVKDSHWTSDFNMTEEIWGYFVTFQAESRSQSTQEKDQ